VQNKLLSPKFLTDLLNKYLQFRIY